MKTSTNIAGAANQSGNFVINGLSKSEARSLVQSMGLSNAQLARATNVINKTTSSYINKVTQNGSEVMIESFRHGHDGYQVLEVVIQVDGSISTFIQKAYNSAGQLVHFDPKK